MKLKTNRGFWKTLLLGMVTFGIYPLIVYSGISSDINIVASPYDGKKTMHYCLLFFIISPITCGIGSLVWSYKINKRMGDELVRRGINYSFGTGNFWLWNILGSCILVGPLVWSAKMIKAMNYLAKDYNING